MHRERSHSLLVLILSVCVSALVACADSAPTAFDSASGSSESQVRPNFGLAGNSGCYTVQFSVALVPTNFPTFTGPVTGDLEGTAELTFDLPFVFRGVVGFGAGPTSWDITGGIVSEVPLAFRTQGSALTLFAPDNDPLLLETHDRHKVIDGVRKANFTGHGVTDITGPQVTRLDYHGVLCP